jgi:hypothetical protein
LDLALGLVTVAVVAQPVPADLKTIAQRHRATILQDVSETRQVPSEGVALVEDYRDERRSADPSFDERVQTCFEDRWTYAGRMAANRRAWLGVIDRLYEPWPSPCLNEIALLNPEAQNSPGRYRPRSVYTGNRPYFHFHNHVMVA